MMQINQTTIRNHLLKALPTDVFDMLHAHMEHVDLPLRHHLVQQNQPIPHVCFIERGLASVVANSSDGKSAEVRHVGREGVTGYQVVMAVDRASTETFMQVAGEGILVPVEPFLQLINGHNVRDLFLRYVHTCETQAVYSGSCPRAWCSLADHGSSQRAG